MPTKILLIDDDVAIAELMSMLLKTHGFEMSTASSGLEGIEYIKKNPANVVLLDLMMPDMNGWDVCKAIRAFSNIPVLVLSAISDPAVVARVLDAGADDFLVKPVPSNVLVAHIKKMVRQVDLQESGLKQVTGPLTKNTQPLPYRL